VLADSDGEKIVIARLDRATQYSRGGWREHAAMGSTGWCIFSRSTMGKTPSSAGSDEEVESSLENRGTQSQLVRSVSDNSQPVSSSSPCLPSYPAKARYPVRRGRRDYARRRGVLDRPPSRTMTPVAVMPESSRAMTSRSSLIPHSARG